MRFLAVLIMLAPLGLVGCAPSYSPDTYATNAAQQANKVEAGHRRRASGTDQRLGHRGRRGGRGGRRGRGIPGRRGPTSAFGAIGGSLVGGSRASRPSTSSATPTASNNRAQSQRRDGQRGAKGREPLWVGKRCWSSPVLRRESCRTTPCRSTRPPKPRRQPSPRSQRRATRPRSAAGLRDNAGAHAHPPAADAAIAGRRRQFISPAGVPPSIASFRQARHPNDTASRDRLFRRKRTLPGRTARLPSATVPAGHVRSRSLACA